MIFKKVLLKIMLLFGILFLSINFIFPAKALSLIPSKTNSKSGNPYYIKNPNKTKYLYVIDQSSMNRQEKAMIATLQGLVSLKSSSQIYILDKSHRDYKLWLEDLREHYGVQYKRVDNPWKLLEKFKCYVQGYVLYDDSKTGDPSINNACSLASLENSIIITKSLEEKVKGCGIKKLKGDCRNTDKYWAFKKLWNCGLNHFTVMELNPSRSSPLRDYAIMTKSLVFYEDSKTDTTLRDMVFGSMEKDSLCLGWGPDEFGNISTASKHGVSVIPADWSLNLSVLSSFSSHALSQKSGSGTGLFKYLEKKFKKQDKKQNSPVHYVTFIMSDGDNQQWNLGSNFSSSRWYSSQYRGKFNMGWSMTPSMYYLAPTALRMYYKNASSGTFQDDFMVSPSGSGYMYPSKFEKSSLKIQIKRLNDYMGKSGESYMAIIDHRSFYNKSLWDQYTSQSNIKGIFYLDYSRQDNYRGKIIWSNGKPVISCRNLLWKGIEDNSSLVKDINGYVAKGYTDTTKESAYTMVYVHAWSKTMGDVHDVVSQLDKNSKIKVVSPNVFMELATKNIKH